MIDYKYRISCKVSRAIFYNFSLLGATTFKGRLCIKGDYVLQKKQKNRDPLMLSTKKVLVKNHIKVFKPLFQITR